ncbi:L-glutamine synthetase [Tistlia consotensis]|uniref:L-glutamine synthetase n=2 Tax=Tistlia consotensis USBA 355 TaxID=560819 RepID=A0A1Y6BQN2_9PROT|nr:glutamine synthetase family protein [Tistlia consotensis]SMF15927.1 L-glutamine synthetase [Tistlia consotensis USBA 355]SNR41587.1 L-glutamine synthetase [Tistlia consotensis]
MSSIEDFLKENRIEEVECLVPDMAGIARGKILPAHKFLKQLDGNALRIPESIFVQTVNGSYPDDENVTDPATSDVYLVPDVDTVRLVPWYPEPTAQVICDPYYFDGSPVPFASRHVLKRVVSLFEAKNWVPIVAAELEFYLVEINEDADYPLRPPIGRSGRRETSRQAYGVDAVNEFDPMFEEIYDFCEAQNIDIDTLAHEAGAAQMEMNFNHGEALAQADQAFLFKRTVREAGLRHKVYATFMAKPMQGEPGSSMHVHQSLVDRESRRNLFATARAGKDTSLFLSYIAGLQRHLPAAMPLFAPNVNSYRRLMPNTDAPINTHWGYDNRTVGLRVPRSGPTSRRVENRVAGADANPYLALAGTLACGYLGMTQRLKPRSPIEGSAYRLAHTLPRTLYDALNRFTSSRPLKEVLGETFIDAVEAVKDAELNAYQEVISSWEREHLLLNV